MARVTRTAILRKLAQWRERDRRYVIHARRNPLTPALMDLIRGWRRGEAEDLGNPPVLVAYLTDWPSFKWHA